ncbi:MAG: hypothetical protein ACRDJU_09905 [Actinomycetota bacterium]
MGSRTEEPHADLGLVRITPQLWAEGFVSTAPGIDGCELVVSIDPHTGGSEGSVGGCGQWPATGAAVRAIDGAMIGRVPDGSLAAVTVSGNGYQESAPWWRSASSSPRRRERSPAPQLTVTGFAGNGTEVGSWGVTLNEWS